MRQHNFSFLREVSTNLKLYNRNRILSGEDFNIFSIMSMESDEVFTHSALLAELMNPRGSHGLGELPLQLFIQQFLDLDYKMNLKNAVCRKEDHIGFTDAEKETGGRVDILVQDLEGNVIIIENKIYAAEQLNQLARYKKNYPDAELFYLTLDGKESDQNTAFTDGEKIYRNLSYKEHIIPWITSCAELSYNKPMLREVLNQYLFLLKKLTNLSTNIEMEEQITDIITLNFEASLEIYRNFENVSKKIKHKLLLELLKDLKEKYPSLKCNLSEFKMVSAISVTGFEEGTTLYFRFKSDRWPVITVQGDIFSTIGKSLPAFKENIKDGKVIDVWKMLPVLNVEKLFKEELVNTKLEYICKISDAIDLLRDKSTEFQNF